MSEIFAEATYELLELPFNGSCVQRTDPDGSIWSIPIDLTNSDYIAYLAWVDSQATKKKTK